MNTLLENRLALVSCQQDRTPVSVALLRAVEAGLRRLAGHVGRRAAAWQRHSDAVAAARTLWELDDRTLRDLGLHRSELISLAVDPRDVTRARIGWLR